ncbi:MAG: hypothetical protein ACLSE4_02185 [Clostridium sp.]
MSPLAVMATALSGGLYATHCLVPPTPGPIAMAGTLEADLGTDHSGWPDRFHTACLHLP